MLAEQVEQGLQKVRIFLVEDHPIMRDGVRRLVNRQADLMVCGEAETPSEALGGIEDVKPDLAIVDLSLKEGSGLELIKDIRVRWPELPVLVLSMHDEKFYAERSLRAGASGYVMKETPGAELMKAIRRVLSGRMYVSEAVSERMLEKMGHMRGDDVPFPIDELSDRELEVFRHLGRGLRPREIASEMNVSVKTIESYSARIRAKLGLKDMSELVQQAISWTKEHDQV